MGTNTVVTSTCLRYIVPFTYTGDFNEICSLVDNQSALKEGKKEQYRKLWKRTTVSSMKAESELYDFIREEFLFADDKRPLSDTKMGGRWMYWNSKELGTGSQAIEELAFIKPSVLKDWENKSKEEQISVFTSALRLRITNLGLFLFRNNLGMIWYELEPDKKPFSSALLVNVQNQIKELNRRNAVYLWRCGKGTPPAYSVIYEEITPEIKHFCTPFSLGHWLTGKIGFLHKNYLVEKKTALPSLIKSYNRFLQKCKCANPEFSPEAQVPQWDCVVPDKSILFTFCTLFDMPSRNPSSSNNDSWEARHKLAYNLTNAYNDSYDCSPDTFKTMRHPFKDAIWFATKEGAGYYKWPNDSNKMTFERVIRIKVATDYFAMFIKALYQSYTMMLLAKQIQDEIPAESFEKMSDTGYKEISRKYEEVNHFLTKSVVTSVSHIHHQGDFYQYIKKQLRIDEDARSVSAGLDALSALQKEKKDEEEKQRDENMQNVMGMISLLAIASAFVDSFDFVAKFSGNTEGGWSDLASSPAIMLTEIILCILIFIISGYAIYYVYRNKKR